MGRPDASTGNVYYFFREHLDSLRVITNATGTIQRDADFYPYGTERVVTGTGDDVHKFAGMYYDTESGLHHTLYRKYSTTLGRWLSADPIRGTAGQPQSFNLYAYVSNNPTNFTDPQGNQIDVNVTFDYKAGLIRYRFVGMTIPIFPELATCDYEACQPAPPEDVLSLCNKKWFLAAFIFAQRGRSECPQGLEAAVLAFAVSWKITITIPCVGTKTFEGSFGACPAWAVTYLDSDPCGGFVPRTPRRRVR